MRQTLFYIPFQIQGIDLFGFGILFWLIVAATIISLLRNCLLRKPLSEYGNTIWIAGIAVVLVAYLAPRIAETNGFPIRGYGVFLMLAIVFSTSLVLWRGKRKWNIPPDLLLTITIVTVVCGILGARLFYVLEYWDSVASGRWQTTLFNILNMTSGGLVVYGSIIAGTCALFGYLIYRRLPIGGTLDLFAPGLMLGIAIGRLGCLMNGCCFGAVCDAPIGIHFPIGSPAHLHQLETGESPLAGLFLQPAGQQNESDRTLIHLKTVSRSLWNNTPCSVTIAAVAPGSPAEEAGIRPGMKIKTLAFAGKYENMSPEMKRGLSTLNVTSNDDVFRFFYSGMTSIPDQFVYMTCDETGKDGTNSSREFFFLPDYHTVHKVWPTQLFSSCGAFLLCLILLLLDRFFKRDGLLFASMFILYAIGRFCIELVRTDESSFYGTGLTVSQCVSLAVLAFGTGLLIALLRLPPCQKYDGMFPRENES